MPHKLREVSVHHFRMMVQGHYLTWNGSEGENSYGAQCVNTWGEFLAECGQKQLAGNANSIDYSQIGATFIHNSPANFPKAGDFVVFQGGRYDASNGHAALALHDSDEHRLHCLWENDPDGSPEQAVYVTYDNCLGWWRFPWHRMGVELTY